MEHVRRIRAAAGRALQAFDNVKGWQLTAVAIIAVSGFVVGHSYGLRQLHTAQDAVIVHVEPENYMFTGRTVVRVQDGRLLDRAGVFGQVGDTVRATPAPRGTWR